MKKCTYEQGASESTGPTVLRVCRIPNAHKIGVADGGQVYGALSQMRAVDG